MTAAEAAATAAYRPDPRHVALGGDFFDVVEPAGFPEHRLRHRNDAWAARVGLAHLDDAEWIDHFGRFRALEGNLERPLALRYHGHQFQSYNPDLGDGRGFLFAQLRDADGRLLDLATKGSGRTPWSRGGDGRLTLKGGVREVLATALLEALGVYTSKSFSLIETGESLERGDEPSPTRSSVLVRLSHSHVRFGSFQRQAALGRDDNLQKLLDYAVETYFPDLAEAEDRAAAFLLRVVDASADLAASWMAAGFVHGVLNTDNMNITGESFDYGPYRFLPSFDPGLTAAYFDQTGLYAYGRQPQVVLWNLSRLAETLLPIAERDPLVGALETYAEKFQRAYNRCLLARLGLVQPAATVGDSASDEADLAFVDAVHRFLQQSQVGFEQFFFDWYGGMASSERASRGPAAPLYTGSEFAPLSAGFARYEAARPEALATDYFSRERPCTLLIDEIERLWSQIAEHDDWSHFLQKLADIEEMRAALDLDARQSIS